MASYQTGKCLSLQKPLQNQLQAVNLGERIGNFDSNFILMCGMFEHIGNGLELKFAFIHKLQFRLSG